MQGRWLRKMLSPVHTGDYSRTVAEFGDSPNSAATVASVDRALVGLVHFDHRMRDGRDAVNAPGLKNRFERT